MKIEMEVGDEITVVAIRLNKTRIELEDGDTYHISCQHDGELKIEKIV
jgi:hypothetical protein